jgi:hypothetical protein
MWHRPAPSRLIVKWMAGSLRLLGVKEVDSSQYHHDPLSNPTFIESFPEMCLKMYRLAQLYHLDFEPHIHTIFPRTTKDIPLAKIFRGRPVHLYYQLYSMDPQFRSQYIPHAQSWRRALLRLLDYQQSLAWHEQCCVRFSWPFFKGLNDDMNSTIYLAKSISESGLENMAFETWKGVPAETSASEAFVMADPVYTEKLAEILNDSCGMN